MRNLVKPLCFVVLVGALLSCRRATSANYNLNQKFEFRTKQEYFNKVSKKNGFNASSLLYIDSSDYMEFGRQVLDSMKIYLGTFINDSVAFKKSTSLKENEFCLGRLEKEFRGKDFLSDLSDGMFDSSINLGQFRFYTVMGNKRIRLSENPKKSKIILLYAYAFGTFYKKFYKDIEKNYKKNIDNTDLYIITIDPVYFLK